MSYLKMEPRNPTAPAAGAGYVDLGPVVASKRHKIPGGNYLNMASHMTQSGRQMPSQRQQPEAPFSVARE